MAYTNFKLIQADAWSIDIYYEDTNSQPIDISQLNVMAEVRDKPGGLKICGVSSTESGGITLIDDQNYNGIKVTFTGEQTSKFVLPKSYYQIKILETSDTLLNGWLEMDPGNF